MRTYPRIQHKPSIDRVILDNKTLKMIMYILHTDDRTAIVYRTPDLRRSGFETLCLQLKSMKIPFSYNNRKNRIFINGQERIRLVVSGKNIKGVKLENFIQYA